MNNQERSLEEELFLQWLEHPVTQHLRKWAKSQRQSLMEQWASGGFTASFEAEMISRNAGATGACSVYSEIIEMDYKQLFGDSDEK